MVDLDGLKDLVVGQFNGGKARFYRNFHNFEDDALAWWLVNQLNTPSKSQSHRDRNSFQTFAEANAGIPHSDRWARGPVQYYAGVDLDAPLHRRSLPR